MRVERDLRGVDLRDEELRALRDVRPEERLRAFGDVVLLAPKPRIEPGGVLRAEDDDLVFADGELRFDGDAKAASTTDAAEAHAGSVSLRARGPFGECL